MYVILQNGVVLIVACTILGKEECAEGPHLHFSVRWGNGAPRDINKLEIGGYRVHTGRSQYDQGCGPDDCKAVMTSKEVAQSCSTILTKIDQDVPEDDQERYCVSIGGNVGMCTNLESSKKCCRSILYLVPYFSLLLKHAIQCFLKF